MSSNSLLEPPSNRGIDSRSRVPPLEPGDELTRDEFERRYQAMPGVKKAELIEGIVHMPSPVRWNQHALPHAECLTWLGVYFAGTPGVQAGDNGSLLLDMDNEPQADAALIIEPRCGGQVQISEDDFIVGAPELVAEIAASSASIDLRKKKQIYRRNQAREYLVWQVLDMRIDWFVLRDGEFQPLQPDENGILRSATFPGLWLDVKSLLEGNLSQVLKVLQAGIASDEHSQFVARLQAAAQI